jgi:hypothetical protein
MEAATAEAPEEQTNGSPPVVADAEKTRHDIFRYSEYVHVGPGVEECELFVALADPERDKTKPLPVCSDPDHFHAWCRLPNPFQVRDIAEKASAARARRARMLKDPESDSHAILEAELDSLLDPTLKDIVVEEIIERDFAEDYDDAMRRVKAVEVEDFVPEDEDDETPKLYANIEQDQEEFTRQTRLPEEQRGDDYEELGKTVRAFTDALNSELESVRKPKRENLLEKSMEELVDIIRQERIGNQGTEAYLHTYNTWQWFVCTFKIPPKGRPHERVWKDINQFKYQTPGDVVGAVQRTFSDLEARLAGQSGNG